MLKFLYCLHFTILVHILFKYNYNNFFDIYSDIVVQARCTYTFVHATSFHLDSLCHHDLVTTPGHPALLIQAIYGLGGGGIPPSALPSTAM